MNRKIISLYLILGFFILLTSCSLFGNELDTALSELNDASSYTIHYAIPGTVSSDIKVEDNKSYLYNIDTLYYDSEHRIVSYEGEQYELVKDGKTYIYLKQNDTWVKREKIDSDFSVNLIDFKILENDWFEEEYETYIEDEEEYNSYILKDKYYDKLFNTDELERVSEFKLSVIKGKTVIEYLYDQMDTQGSTGRVRIEISEINNTTVKLPTINE